ncbi:MAG: SBBP repeat-containing protein [bacterium]
MNKLFILFTILLIPSLTWSKDKEHNQLYNPLQVRADEYLKQAFELYNTSEFKKAICLYKKTLDLKPDFAQGWYLLGKSYYRAGQMDQFFSAWDRCVKLSKEDTDEIRRKMKMYLETYTASNIYEHLDTIKGEAEYVFYTPTGIAIDSEDNIYISSFGSNAILKFSPIGNLLLQFGSKGKGKLDRPYGITLDREDNIYVTDYGNHRVQKFTPQGKFLMEFGKKGRKAGEFINPEGIDLDRYGNIYVVDNGNSRIQIFSKEGKFIGKISKMGEGEDTLLNPIGVAVDEKNGVWIIEHEGKYLKKFTTSDSWENNFAFPQEGLVPQGITYSPDGKLYITFLQGVIFRFDIENQRWERVNITTKLSKPSAVTMNKYGLLYVANFDNNSINIFMPEEFKKNRFDVLVNRVDTNDYPTISMPVTVTTQDKIPILGLTSNNFKVEEDGKWMLPITLGTPVHNNEYMVAIFIIDTSDKMVKYGDDVKILLNKFIDDMKGGIQAASIIGFGEKAKQIQQITRNKTVLRDSIENLTFGNTKDKEAIFSAIRLGVNNIVNLICKKVICLITCGEEVEEGTLFRECSYYAKNNHIPIFVVDYRLQGETKSMKDLATNSLGDYFLAYKSLRAHKLYKSIASQIKNQNIYFISYKSPQEEWALEWTDVTVSAGHGQLYAKDKISYIVPRGKGMDKKIVEKIAERIKKRKLEQIAKKREKEHKLAHKEAVGHGEVKKPAGFPPPAEWSEGIQIDIGEPDREKYVTDEEEAKKPAAHGHGGGH